MIRLQKYLASSGVSSRRAAERLISDGHVRVNGTVVTEMGVKVDELTADIRIDGKRVRQETVKYYIAYNKPIGEVTTASDPQGRDTVMDRFRDFPVRLFPVGRLDYDSEGLLLLTNDGEMMNNTLHPSREIRKTYLARVCGFVSDDEIRRLTHGIMLDGRITSPARVRRLRSDDFATMLLVAIHEGRYRQVRRMFETTGHRILNLKRVGFGPVLLGDLPRGHWRMLTNDEIKRLGAASK